uniref:Uncharacterized protein n=1 Tax=Cannabis sativa TaxID=3483 RepID=A0A803R400_CANSA
MQFFFFFSRSSNLEFLLRVLNVGLFVVVVDDGSSQANFLGRLVDSNAPVQEKTLDDLILLMKINNLGMHITWVSKLWI